MYFKYFIFILLAWSGSFLFFINPATSKELEIIKIAYIEIENDERYDPDLAYTRIQLKPTGRPFAGAMVAYKESDKLFDILGKKMEITRIKVENVDEIFSKIDELSRDNTNFFLVDAEKDFFTNLSKLKSKNVAIFNITEQDNSLRQENCDNRVFHAIPSNSMFLILLHNI